MMKPNQTVMVIIQFMLVAVAITLMLLLLSR